jgi:hypothetical protein
MALEKYWSIHSRSSDRALRTDERWANESVVMMNGWPRGRQLRSRAGIIHTVIPDVHDLVEASEVCAPVAQELRVVGSHVYLLVRELDELREGLRLDVILQEMS